jgi:hypothetical protein
MFNLYFLRSTLCKQLSCSVDIFSIGCITNVISSRIITRLDKVKRNKVTTPLCQKKSKQTSRRYLEEETVD